MKDAIGITKIVALFKSQVFLFVSLLVVLAAASSFGNEPGQTSNEFLLRKLNGGFSLSGIA